MVGKLVIRSLFVITFFVAHACDVSAQQEYPNPSVAPFVLNAVERSYIKVKSENLVNSANSAGGRTFRHPVTQEVHSVQFFYRFPLEDPFQIIDLNLDTGTIRYAQGSGGRPFAGGMAIHPKSGKIYITTQAPSFLNEYDPNTGENKVIHVLADTAAHDVTIGTDEKVYIGEAIKGYVERYDPSLDPTSKGVDASWKNFGILADPGGLKYYRYVYTLGADGNFIYAAVRDQNFAPLWRFVVKNINTGEEREYWKDIPASSMQAVPTYRGYGVGCYTVAPSPTKCFRFNGFEIAGEVITSRLQDAPAFQAVQNNPARYEVDLTETYPNDLNGGEAVIRYKRPTDTLYRLAKTPPIKIGPTKIDGLFSFDGKSLLGATPGYGPMFSLNPMTLTPKILGLPILSYYGGFYSQYHNRMYLHGYPTLWMEYDPNAPFTMTLNSQYDTKSNPHMLPHPPSASHLAAKYYYYSAEDADHFVWLGGHHERDSTGGSVMWFDPMQQESGVVRAEWPDGNASGHGVLREPFVGKQITGMISAVNGTKMVIATNRDIIYVVDVKTKTIERTINQMVDGPMMEVSSGKIDGCVGRKIKNADGTETKINTLWQLDVTSGTLLKTVQLSAPLFYGIPAYQRRFVTGPDGYIWAYQNADVVRFHPNLLEVLPVISNYGPAQQLLFVGSELYIYGQQFYIRKVSNLFTRKVADTTPPEAPKNLVVR